MTFSPTVLGSGVGGYAYLKRTREAQQGLFQKSAVVSRETKVFAEKIERVETSDQLMADRAVLKVALGAFGLSEDINNRAFIKKILDSDLSDTKSLANRLADKRYLAFAQAFNFASPDGPRLPDAASPGGLSEKMAGLSSADDLLADRSLLRASLAQFGLEDNIGNTYFLKQVLVSDLSDPSSFANRMPDKRLVDFARAFDFFAKDAEKSQNLLRLDGLVDAFSGRLQSVDTAAKLLQEPAMLTEALNIFGLDNIFTSGFLSDVLNSDLNDPESFANSLTDKRFAAFSAAFNFATPVLDALRNPVLDLSGDPVMKKGTLETFISAVATSDMPETPDEFLSDTTLRGATFGLLGIPDTVSNRGLAKRILESDPAVPTSLVNVFPDNRYKSLAAVLDFRSEPAPRGYPAGFVEQVTNNYIAREFEARVGDIDPTMRIALSLERELGQVARGSGSNDAKWFAIMASPPLRQVFEGAFGFPSSFGSIDIDQQLVRLKARSEKTFGTSDVSELTDPEKLDTLRQRYLLLGSIQSSGSFTSANAASIILSSLNR
jgi:hypothetical protein